MARNDREQFSNTQSQLVGAGFFGFVAIVGLLMTSRADAIAGWIFVGLGLGLVVRSFCSSDVVVSRDAVRTRSLVFTRRVPLEDITSADVEVGRTGMNGFDRQYLVLHRVAGDDVAFKALNSAPSTSSAAVTTVQQAAHAIQPADRPLRRTRARRCDMTCLAGPTGRSGASPIGTAER